MALDAVENVLILLSLLGVVVRTLSSMRVDRCGHWTGVHVGLDGRLRTYRARYIS